MASCFLKSTRLSNYMALLFAFAVWVPVSLQGQSTCTAVPDMTFLTTGVRGLQVCFVGSGWLRAFSSMSQMEMSIHPCIYNSAPERFGGDLFGHVLVSELFSLLHTTICRYLA